MTVAVGIRTLDDDEKLLVDTVVFDPQTFAALYRRHVDPVYRFCYRRLGTKEAAEDATAQVFIKALAALPAYRGGSFQGWLFAIAHNVVADESRAARPHSDLETAAEIADSSPGPEAAALAADEARAIRELLTRLPVEQRRVLELRLAGLTGIEIAQALGRSHGTIRNLQHRTLVRLRVLLGVKANPTGGKLDA